MLHLQPSYAYGYCLSTTQHGQDTGTEVNSISFPGCASLRGRRCYVYIISAITDIFRGMYTRLSKYPASSSTVVSSILACCEHVRSDPVGVLIAEQTVGGQAGTGQGGAGKEGSSLGSSLACSNCSETVANFCSMLPSGTLVDADRDRNLRTGADRWL